MCPLRASRLAGWPLFSSILHTDPDFETRFDPCTQMSSLHLRIYKPQHRHSLRAASLISKFPDHLISKVNLKSKIILRYPIVTCRPSVILGLKIGDTVAPSAPRPYIFESVRGYLVPELYQRMQKTKMERPAKYISRLHGTPRLAPASK